MSITDATQPKQIATVQNKRDEASLRYETFMMNSHDITIQLSV